MISTYTIHALHLLLQDLDYILQQEPECVEFARLADLSPDQLTRLVKDLENMLKVTKRFVDATT